MPSHSTPSRLFYVYTLARPDGRVFYIGKGSGKRINDHEGQARGGCNCHKCNIIRKVWADGGAIGKAIVFETEDEAEAFEMERRLIADAPLGSLANRTIGGEGFTGGRHTEESKRRISEASPRRGKPLTSEQRATLAAGLATRNYGPLTDEHKQKISDRLKGRPKNFADTEARSRHLAESHQGVHLSEAHKQRIAAGMQGRVVSDETKRRISEAKKRGYATRRAASQ